MLTAALLALALQGPTQADLHPAEATVFLEAPSIQAVLGAYGAAPMARMFADADALAALRRMLGQPGMTGRSLIDSAFEPLGLEGVDLDLVSGLEAASFSMGGSRATGDLFALAVVDAVDPEHAAEVAKLLAGGGRWIEADGNRVVAGAGTMTVERWHAVRDGGPSLRSAGRAGGDAGKLRPTDGAVVLRGLQKQNLVRALDDLAGADHAPLPELWDQIVGSGETDFVMALDHGRFVTQSWAAGRRTPIAAAPWLAPKPVDPAVLREVHPGSLLVVATSFEREGLRNALAGALATDLSGAHVFDELGSNAVLFVQPIRGPGIPKGFLVVDLESADGVLDDVAAMFPKGGEVEADSRKYKDVPYVSLSIPRDVASLGELGTLHPVLAVFDGKLFVTNGTLAMKAEIRRRQGDEREQLGPASYPWTNGGAAVGDDVTALVYFDWANQVDSLFSLARSFGGALGSVAPDLPFDLSNLPDPKLFTAYMPPTMHTVHALEGGTYQRHEAGFGFETWAGLVGIGNMVASALEGSFATPEPVPAHVVAPAVGPADVTASSISELRTALAVYKIDQGKFPSSLDALVAPTANYPMGFLGGKTAVEPDGWGNAFRYELADGGAAYRLWSTGPDGVDQDGAGDDLRAP